MASKGLQEAIANYDAYIEAMGVTQEVVDAYVMASEVALATEKDEEYGLKVSEKAKKLVRQFILEKTGGTLEQLEAYKFANHIQEYDILNKYYQVLRSEAFYKFDSFIEYMELRREPLKRFYYPRKNTLEVVVHDLEDLANRKIKFLGVSLPSRTGKLIADDTPVLTENGWKRHGDLVEGDYVYDFDGQLTKVIYVHPKMTANKRVWFSDGEYIDCHENHEWVLYDKNSQREMRVETKYVEKHLKTKEGEKERCRWYLPAKSILNGKINLDLKVPPYVLGTWLGDGTNKKPVITICDTDKEILTEIEKQGYHYTTAYKQTSCTAYSFENLRKDLQNYGMCMRNETTEKHIPVEYLLSHPAQRLELLAGLLDTDGTLVPKEHRYHFSTISERLKDDVVSLISSFGWRVCVTEQEPKVSTSGIVGKHKVYTIGFNPTFEIPCKVERKQLKEFSKQRRISIERIEDIEPVSGNCITVMGGIYRVGKRMIPTHNSTLCIFFLAWIALKRPNSHSAMGGHSGILAKGFYKEFMNLIATNEYTFPELYGFWNREAILIRDKSAEDLTVNLDQPDRFATFTARGIDGTWTGAVDVSWDGILFVDDLIRDREHSLSPMRMDSTFQEYLNKMVDRKSGFDPNTIGVESEFAGSCELMVGTLWNVLDPLERIRKQYEDNPLYRFRKIPALNEMDESNFKYLINGFSTEYYKEIRERLDNAEWMAKYQQQPYVREGLLMPADKMKRFERLPRKGSISTLACCDPSLGGGDYLSMPICYTIENQHYIVDWVFNNNSQKTTIPQIVDKLIKWEISELHIEVDGVGSVICKEIKDELKRRNVSTTSVIEHYASRRISKQDKIKGSADYILDTFYFLDGSSKEYLMSKEYKDALANVNMYTTTGKNKTDDAIDSLAQMANVFKPLNSNGTIEAINNPFGVRMGMFNGFYY